MIFDRPPVDDPVCQGDILDACPIFGFDASAKDVDLKVAPKRWEERVIVLTQACDLTQAKTNKVLVALLHPAQTLVDRGMLKGTTIRDQMRRGQVYGWYFLPSEVSVSLPESIIDLHDLHTVPLAVLQQLMADGKRVCRLLSPYREHLAQHFAVTYMRIGLPAPLESES